MSCSQERRKIIEEFCVYFEKHQACFMSIKGEICDKIREETCDTENK